MPSPEKIATVNEIKEKIDSSKIAILAEFKGLNVAEVTELRKLFREAEVDYKVYKNTLIRIASEQLNIDNIEEYLIGTTALAISKDPVAPAKIAKDFSKNHDNFKIKAGILDKKVIASGDIEALADLPPREVLLANILGSIQSPLSGLVTVLQGTIKSLLYALKDLSNKMDEGGESVPDAEENKDEETASDTAENEDA
ncbi:50S ribosomal protein L10 [Candidatus Poribacteria bacterium]|nr:50S ribosomal protein L10 [Candidatus Poribacteria bacterium]